jgi:hypothetical protein
MKQPPGDVLAALCMQARQGYLRFESGTDDMVLQT